MNTIKSKEIYKFNIESIKSNLPFTDEELEDVTAEIVVGDVYLLHNDYPPVVLKRKGPLLWTVNILDSIPMEYSTISICPDEEQL